MIKIAIIDDHPSDNRHLKENIDRFFSDKETTYSVDAYTDPLKFLDGFSSQYDLIALDIEMPSMDGMTLAHRIRKLDSVVILVFITDHAGYAINGYEVGALDFMVKPVNYYDFALKMKRVMSQYERNHKGDRIIVKTSEGMVQLRQRDIMYVEIVGHWATYHTKDGDFRYYGTLKDVEQLLDPVLFCRCNSCYLVNLSYVEKMEQLSCVVAGHELKISMPKKKEFTDRLVKYYAMGGQKQ